MSFNVSEFISESNLIDPQPSIIGMLIPGAKPGDLMYDNHLRAYKLALEKVDENKLLNKNDVLDIHRELTRKVDFFELQGMSGRFRNCDVWLNRKDLPPIHFAPQFMVWWLMDTVWTKFYASCMEEGKNASDETKEKLAFQIHDLFESIHPFIDGNGRTGRVILNAARVNLGLKPITILYNNREAYYEKINAFRQTEYDTIVSKFKSEASS